MTDIGVEEHLHCITTIYTQFFTPQMSVDRSLTVSL